MGKARDLPLAFPFLKLPVLCRFVDRNTPFFHIFKVLVQPAIP